MKPSPVRAILVMALAAGALLAPAGCGSRDPLERTVAVPTATRFAAWRSHVESDSGPELRRQVEDALQEIRLRVAGEREVKRVMGEAIEVGSASIDEGLRARIDGQPLREIFQLAYELRVRRLAEELAGLEDAMSKNAQLTTRAGDYESKQHLETLRDRQMGRVAKYREDLAAAEKQLAPLLAKTGHRLLPTEKAAEKPAETPDVLPERVPAPQKK